MNQKPIRTGTLQHGVVLLEALIAILIFTFGILGLVGLQGAMVRNTTEAQYRTEATYVVQQVLGQMWANPCNISTLPDGDNLINPSIVPDLSERLPNGRLDIRHYRSGNTPEKCPGSANAFANDQTIVTVRWMLPGDGNDPSAPPDSTTWRRVVQSVSITGG